MGPGGDCRERLRSTAQLEEHLRSSEQFPAQLWLYRFHPDTWTAEEMDLDEDTPQWLQRLWGSELWADCLCLNLTSPTHAWVSYYREPGDDGIMLFNPARERQSVELLTLEQGHPRQMAGWHTVSSEAARPLAKEFVVSGHLPHPPAGTWWIDQDEQRVELAGLWAEQERAWVEQRRLFLQKLGPCNQRGDDYAQEFAVGSRVCPLCRQGGRVRYLPGGQLAFSSFICEACDRSFAIADVDRTPQSRVE